MWLFDCNIAHLAANVKRFLQIFLSCWKCNTCIGDIITGRASRPAGYFFTDCSIHSFRVIFHNGADSSQKIKRMNSISGNNAFGRVGFMFRMYFRLIFLRESVLPITVNNARNPPGGTDLSRPIPKKLCSISAALPILFFRIIWQSGEKTQIIAYFRRIWHPEPESNRWPAA